MENEALRRSVYILKILVPQFEEILQDIRSGHGLLNFPSAFQELLSKEGLPSWAKFYEDPLKLKALTLKALLGNQQTKELIEQFKDKSEDEKIAFREELKTELIESGALAATFDNVTTASLDEARESWNTMTGEEQTEGQVHLFLVLYSMITQIHYYLALMTFGCSICDLVAKAKKGDDDAFFKAVQIDKTILTDIPYFRKRLLIAHTGCEPQFFANLSNAIKGPLLGKKLSYPMLMLVFAVLDDEGFLDLPLDQLMDICEEVGVYGREFGIEDVNSLRLRRKYYREKTGRQIRF